MTRNGIRQSQQPKTKIETRDSIYTQNRPCRGDYKQNIQGGLHSDDKSRTAAGTAALRGLLRALLGAAALRRTAALASTHTPQTTIDVDLLGPQ